MRTEKDFLKYLDTILQMAKEEGYDSLDETFVEHVRCRYLGLDVVIARTERILLREIKISDLEAFYGFTGAQEEPVLRAFLRETREESGIYLQSYLEGMYSLYDYGIWSIERVSDGKVIGLCGLGRRKIAGEEVTDLGYYICPEMRGRGYAVEAVTLALEYGRDYVGLSEIYAVVQSGNDASVRILEKFGFFRTEEGKTEKSGSQVFRKSL